MSINQRDAFLELLADSIVKYNEVNFNIQFFYFNNYHNIYNFLIIDKRIKNTKTS